MEEENLILHYETISVSEQRNLIEVTRDISRALTKEEYKRIMSIYYKVTTRLTNEAQKQGFEI